MIYQNRRLRHENKFIVSPGIAAALRSRLRAVLKPDVNAQPHGVTDYPDSFRSASGGYRVTSLYFEDVYQTAYNDKLAGLFSRKKFRVRAYNLDVKTAHLEIKFKDGEYVSKTAAPLTPERYASLLKGNCGFGGDEAFEGTAADDLLVSQSLTGQRPVVLVDYYREAWVNPAGNVRVTFDSALSTSYNSLDMFNARFSPVLDGSVVLELKYDNFLPAVVADVFSGFDLTSDVISKYVLCLDKLTEVKKQCSVYMVC